MSILEKARLWGEDAAREHDDALVFGHTECRVIAREYVAIARERSDEHPQVVSSFVAGWKAHRALMLSGLEFVADDCREV